MLRCVVLSACLLVGVCRGEAGEAAPPAEPSGTPRVDFQREIRPILAERCYRCHGPDEARRKGDLRLDTRDGATHDLGGRRAVDVAQPDDSELLLRVTTVDDTLRMPPPDAGASLTPREVKLLRQWIESGAPYTPHWLLAPLARPLLPPVKDDEWSRNPIDRFILAGLESQGLRPAVDANPRTLVRRLSQDLLALPATGELVRELGAQPDEAAWQALCNRLLDHPALGERLAMTWFDLVRYADTVGYHGDQEHAIAPYRDYVIAAFNQNLPFDRMTREQLAGDLLPEPTLDQRIATGYLRVLQTSHEGGVQKAEYLKKYDADRVRNLGAVWLGMTVACAECHDHKYDPISQRDFYSLAAFFADIDDNRSFDGGDSNPTRRAPEIEIPSEEDQRALDRLTAELAALPAEGEAEEKAARKKEIDALRKRGRRSMIVERIAPRTIRVLARGNWMDESGPIVEPRPPAALAAFHPPGERPTRLDLAEWLTGEARGQTARVFVNRLWALVFGQGLSRTLDDSGVQGAPPSHPELLDWLAAEFVESGWDVKHLLRLMVTSRAYRQSSLESPELRERDPENRWLARQGRWRIPAEGVRDQALAVSGLLVTQVGGKSARPWQPAGYYVQLNFPRREYQPDQDEGQYRRGVYMHWQRQYLHPMLKAFDAPMREECTAQRDRSNTPQAALVLLNDPSFVECARGLAVRALREGGTTDDSRLEFAWEELLARPPTGTELGALREYLDQARLDFADEGEAREFLAVGMIPVPAEPSTRELAAWTATMRLLWSLSESLTRE